MRLLDRYLLRELLIPFAYCLCGFLIFWIAFDLFDDLGKFQARNLKGRDVLELYAVKTPEMLSVVLPVALLLALLYALTNHARHNELTAMRAAGASLWRLSLPYFAVGLFLSVLLFVINESWVSKSGERIERIMMRRTPSALAMKDWKRDLNFRNEAEQRSWRIGLYNLNTATFSNVSLQWHLADGSWRDIYAESVQWTNNAWHFSNIEEWRYPPSEKGATQSIAAAIAAAPVPVTNVSQQFTFPENPELIRSELKINNLSAVQAAKRPQLSIREINNYLRLHPNVAPHQAAKLNTQLHGRIAEAWTCLVVVLIALPFGAASGRRNVFVGVAASIFICFAYFILLRVGLALGIGGHLPGWLAAWMPNILFGLAGIVLTNRAR